MQLKLWVSMLALGVTCGALLSMIPRGSLAQSPSGDPAPDLLAPTGTCSGQGSSYLCKVVFHGGPTCVVTVRPAVQCPFGSATPRKSADAQTRWTAGGPDANPCELFMSGGPTCVVSVGAG